MLKDPDVKAVATEVFTDALGPSRFDRLEVKAGLDHDGDASFFVTLYLQPGVDPHDVVDVSKAHATLRRRLLDLDEERFPYLQNQYPDDEILVGEDEPEAG